MKSASRTNEETGTDGTTDSNHLHVSVLQLSVQRTYSIYVGMLPFEFEVVAVIVVWRVSLLLGDDLLLVVARIHGD